MATDMQRTLENTLFLAGYIAILNKIKAALGGEEYI
jgi:hypothetical protein